MEHQIIDFLWQYYRELALAASGLLFMAVVNGKFRTMLLQTVTIVLLAAGVLISYASITNHRVIPDVSGYMHNALAMTQTDAHNGRQSGQQSVIR